MQLENMKRRKLLKESTSLTLIWHVAELVWQKSGGGGGGRGGGGAAVGMEAMAIWIICVLWYRWECYAWVIVSSQLQERLVELLLVWLANY